MVYNFDTFEQIDGAKSPAIDFFNRAPSAANILDAQLPAAARIGIAIFWQVSSNLHCSFIVVKLTVEISRCKRFSFQTR